MLSYGTGVNLLFEMAEESVSNLENAAEIEFDGPAFFQKEDAKKLFQGKRVYFIGDSSKFSHFSLNVHRR